MLKRSHLNSLQQMILGQSAAVPEGMIKSDDISIEYIVMFSIIIIASLGAFVAWQVQKAGTALPLASSSKSRLD